MSKKPIADEPSENMADKLKAISNTVLKTRDEADKAEPPLDVIERGAKQAIAVALAAAEQGRYECSVNMHDANYQTVFRVLQTLKEQHGFSGSQKLTGNQWQMDLRWA